MNFIIKDKGGHILIFDRKKDFLEWARKFYTLWDINQELSSFKELAIVLWLEWDCIFNPSKYTCEDVLNNLSKLQAYKEVLDPQERKLILEHREEHLYA